MERTEIEGAINAYKNLLQQTDYMAIKHADGALTPEEYGPMRAKREEWREAINQCEAQLAALDEQEPAEQGAIRTQAPERVLFLRRDAANTL